MHRFSSVVKLVIRSVMKVITSAIYGKICGDEGAAKKKLVRITLFWTISKILGVLQPAPDTDRSTPAHDKVTLHVITRSQKLMNNKFSSNFRFFSRF